MELKSLTTKEVARLCQVSDATVKRWEDAGLLHSERTGGGHRRFRAEEIARFRRTQDSALRNSANGGAAILKTTVRRRYDAFQTDSELFHTLVAGSEEDAANIIIAAHLDGKTASEIFDEVLCPAMRQIGELWYRGELSITQEHIATRAADRAVYKLRNVLPAVETNAKLVMCCALEGDFHELPTHLAQTVFESEGWEVLNFGANTPLYSLGEEIVRHAPELVCISATVINDCERLARDYRIFTGQIEKLKIPIILGGRAFGEESFRRRFPAALYARSFREIVGFSERLASES